MTDQGWIQGEVDKGEKGSLPVHKKKKKIGVKWRKKQVDDICFLCLYPTHKLPLPVHSGLLYPPPRQTTVDKF